MRVTFPKFPTWNFHFKEKDVKAIGAVKYRDKEDAEQTLPADKYRLAIGRNGVSSIVFLEKHSLPATKERSDAVIVEYEA
jgi:hypothetical protein